MKIVYYGGQKSGKTSLAQQRGIELSKDKKPYYIATYNNSYSDKEMQERVLRHQKDRKERFITIEESKNLSKHIKPHQTYLIDCISMWILNSIDTPIEELLDELDRLDKIDTNIIFVLNSVNEGVIPIDTISRRFIDYTGIIGQKLASISDEVYEVKLGLQKRLK